MLQYVLVCRRHVLSPCLMIWTNGPRTCSRCATLMHSAWIWITVKVKVSLTSHEGSYRGWNVWHSPLHWYPAQLGRQGCQLHAPTALHPQGKSLSVISVRRWKDWRRTQEVGHLTIFRGPLTNCATSRHREILIVVLYYCGHSWIATLLFLLTLWRLTTTIVVVPHR